MDEDPAVITEGLAGWILTLKARNNGLKASHWPALGAYRGPLRFPEPLLDVIVLRQHAELWHESHHTGGAEGGGPGNQVASDRSS